MAARCPRLHTREHRVLSQPRQGECNCWLAFCAQEHARQGTPALDEGSGDPGRATWLRKVHRGTNRCNKRTHSAVSANCVFREAGCVYEMMCVWWTVLALACSSPPPPMRCTRHDLASCMHRQLCVTGCTRKGGCTNCCCGLHALKCKGQGQWHQKMQSFDHLAPSGKRLR